MFTVVVWIDRTNFVKQLSAFSTPVQEIFMTLFLHVLPPVWKIVFSWARHNHILFATPYCTVLQIFVNQFQVICLDYSCFCIVETGSWSRFKPEQRVMINQVWIRIQRCFFLLKSIANTFSKYQINFQLQFNPNTIINTHGRVEEKARNLDPEFFMSFSRHNLCFSVGPRASR